MSSYAALKWRDKKIRSRSNHLNEVIRTFRRHLGWNINDIIETSDSNGLFMDFYLCLCLDREQYIRVHIHARNDDSEVCGHVSVGKYVGYDLNERLDAEQGYQFCALIDDYEWRDDDLLLTKLAEWLNQFKQTYSGDLQRQVNWRIEAIEGLASVGTVTSIVSGDVIDPNVVIKEKP